MNIRTNLQIGKLKKVSIDLKVNYQIPMYLYKCIQCIDSDTDTSIVNVVKFYTECYLHIKGFYKKYPLLEKKANDELKKVIVIDNRKIILAFQEEGSY